MLIINNTTDANNSMDQWAAMKLNATNTTTVIKSIYHFMVGFIGGIFGDKAPNTMMCTGNFTKIANASILLYNHIIDAANASDHMAQIDIMNKTTYN